MKMTAVVDTVSKLVRHSLLAAPIALAPLAAGMMLQSVGFDDLLVGQVQAAEEQKPQHNTKKTYSLREPVFKEFAKIQNKTDANDWKGALVVLEEIRRNSGKFTSFEKANLWNYYGWVYYSLENYPKSIEFYDKVLTEPELSEALRIGTLYTVAQLKFIQEDYRGAIDKLKQYMKVQPIVGADVYVLLAQGYYQLNDMKSALTNINIAVDQYESKGNVPKENWYTLQRAIYYDQNDNKKVISILEKLLRHYPNASYWKQLSGMFGAVGRERDQLHAMETAYLMGAVTTESELLNLAYLMLGEDVPYKAAKVIDKGMKAGKIAENAKNLEVLSTAWRMAQEIDKSIPTLEKAAQKSGDGDLYARLAGIYLDSDKNQEALNAGDTALKRGGIKRADQLYIVLGMARANLKQYEAAVKAFQQAAKDERSRKFADQWIQFSQSELEREKQLKLKSNS